MNDNSHGPFTNIVAENGELKCRYCFATCQSTPEELDKFDSSRVVQWARRHAKCLEKVFRKMPRRK
jgi:hypothetical protein